MKKEHILLLAAIGLAVGVVMLSSSQCTGNCRTIAKYVTQHSANTLLIGLLAV